MPRGVGNGVGLNSDVRVDHPDGPASNNELEVMGEYRLVLVLWDQSGLTRTPRRPHYSPDPPHSPLYITLSSQL